MKFRLLALLATVGFGLSAQVSTIPAEDLDPEDSVKIIVDLSKLDDTKDYVQNLQSAADNGEDIYIWTWSPFEFPAGHPKTNGTGAQAWKNSNDILKMKKEGTDLYSFTIIPTEFYEVDAATVYEKDISFLVKTKDGGGFGDPDIKSDDLKVEFEAPKLERDPGYAFPATGQPDDVITIFYENDREEKTSMQNLGPDEVYVYAEATLSDSSVVKIAPNLFQVGSFPELKMDFIGNNTYRKFIYANDFFPVPQGLSVSSMKFVIMRQMYLSGDDRLDYDIAVELDCQ